ncbi:Mrx12p SKDI_10G2100 [Saccharomyces kudriavzevii IFO 1802]|uniref:Uncharacterized protein n=2 Tax=Saccharomyces kudriavzevii (strain ATCC MYA-4449 / AS 2.2408 / CBS 8840 / NBRC 1802 / NCYC 2889) TaxID=226230 RepID=A0AA35NGP2_SACK1|nr:uncharacterized protein SKDI_10G2100 [Saccharomyces kudriavzevii IFO 1802]EJT42030.1 YJR003C-like protein [Saccharomyces kudriavzevii IFO 1802]CAI4043806.1 hypothetical protein SKDI_10G2100 [Saccharomyces kudriavzevii IFO 1802]
MLRSLHTAATSANRRLYSLACLSNRNGNKIIETLLSHHTFDPIRRHLPTDTATLDPYSLSQNVIKSLNTLRVAKEDAAVIHNMMIENLSGLDYSIATIHSKNLRDLGLRPSVSAIKQIIKNNPGRVQSSWEIFMKYKALVQNVPDELIEVVLEKIINFDKAEKIDGKEKLTFQDLARCLYLMDHLSSKNVISSRLIEPILIYAIDNGIPNILAFMVEYKIPLNFFDKYINELTPCQLFDLYSFYAPHNVIVDPLMLHKCVAILGENGTIALTEDENEIISKLQEEIESVKLQCHDSWDFDFPKDNARKTETAFKNLFLEIRKRNLDKMDFKLALTLLRVIGAFKGDIALFFELYYEYLLNFKNNEESLMFEAFLALSCQGYKKGNVKMLEYADAFVNDGTDDMLKSKTLSVLIVANAKTNINLSLQIYNSNIAKANKGKNDSTDLADSDILTESLILAFLSKGDADFARVIFDGALGEKVISGPTAAKRIKKLLARYGEAVEAKESKEVMQSRIEHYMKTI